MTDDQVKARWATITDPREALAEIVKHSWCLGGDPYYNDLVEALMDMGDRALAATEERAQAVTTIVTK